MNYNLFVCDLNFVIFFYTRNKKLETVDYAELHGNRLAPRFFEIIEKNVRNWRTNKSFLKVMKPIQRALRHRQELWPELESILKDWVISERTKKSHVSTVQIRLKAKEKAESSQSKTSNQVLSGVSNLCEKQTFGQSCDISWTELAE